MHYKSYRPIEPKAEHEFESRLRSFLYGSNKTLVRQNSVVFFPSPMPWLCYLFQYVNVYVTSFSLLLCGIEIKKKEFIVICFLFLKKRLKFSPGTRGFGIFRRIYHIAYCYILLYNSIYYFVHHYFAYVFSG